MAFWLLPNTIGNAATAVSLIGSTATGAGAVNDLISGPRSTFWRSTPVTNEMAIGYDLASDLVPTHLVVARADWMVTQSTAALKLVQRNSSAVWSYLGSAINPFTVSSLVGPKLQDYVVAITPSVYRGFGVDFDPVSAESFQMSKMYFSTGFSFDGEINLQSLPEWEPILQNQSVNLFIPQLGYMPYEVESSIKITWKNNTKASILAFKALPQLLNWPLFLYDDAAELWSWKLEHVIIEGWEETIVNKDIHDITISFKRLKLYE